MTVAPRPSFIPFRLISDLVICCYDFHNDKIMLYLVIDKWDKQVSNSIQKT